MRPLLAVLKPRPLAIMLLLVAVAGCGSTPEERFYTLAANWPQQRVQSAGYAFSVAVGPVTVPAIVDRPQMVLRTGSNRVIVAEQSRWAAPLTDSIARAIAGNLAQLMGNSRVSAYSEGMSADADYWVPIDVQRFESAPGDAATVEVLWTVRAAGQTLRAGHSAIREPVGGGGEEALVAAHERALAAVSRDIAAALREVGAPN